MKVTCIKEDEFEQYDHNNKTPIWRTPVDSPEWAFIQNRQGQLTIVSNLKLLQTYLTKIDTTTNRIGIKSNYYSISSIILEVDKTYSIVMIAPEILKRGDGSSYVAPEWQLTYTDNRSINTKMTQFNCRTDFLSEHELEIFKDPKVLDKLGYKYSNLVKLGPPMPPVNEAITAPPQTLHRTVSQTTIDAYEAQRVKEALERDAVLLKLTQQNKNAATQEHKKETSDSCSNTSEHLL